MDKLIRKTSIQTRNRKICPVFGKGKLMNKNLLPTYRDIIKHFMLVRQELTDGQAKEATVNVTSNKVCEDLEQIWHRASIPVISHQQIIAKINNYHDKFRTLMKPYKQRCKESNYLDKIESFKRDSDLIFDIAACKCTDLSMCTCEKIRKIPINERAFLVDQRNERKMMIGNVDIKTTKQQERKLMRKHAAASSLLNFKCANSPCAGDLVLQKQHSSDDDSDLVMMQHSHEPANEEETMREPQQTDRCSLKTNSQMRHPLPVLARECDRWGVSDRSAAAIASAVLVDFGIISEQDSSAIIDPSKIRRERQKNRKSLQTNAIKAVEGLYFDGRKDKTRNQIMMDNKFHPVTETEEHIVLIKEPESEYLGHVKTSSGTSLTVTNNIVEFLNQNTIDTSTLVALGCDGTKVNTGCRGGVIRLLEVHLKKPLHWFVCLLHINELPLRHILIHLDGVTHGPNSFSGPIGKQLKEECDMPLPVVTFQPIEGNVLPNIDRKDLSTDQNYLLEICQAITTGQCSSDLGNLKPGPLCHSRWLTTANWILRLYISKENPDKNLITLVTYIVKVYAPIWFQIKSRPSCTEGSRHLFNIIHYTRYLSADLKRIVDPVIQRNPYFAHPENLLIAMASNERPHIRQLALRRVLAARSSYSEIDTIPRVFKVPMINFEAKEYTEMISWSLNRLTEPPMFRSFPSNQLEENIRTSEILQFTSFPCHTQAVERGIKLVTEACAAVCEPQRDGFIRARIESLSAMKAFNTKSDFNVM